MILGQSLSSSLFRRELLSWGHKMEKPHINCLGLLNERWDVNVTNEAAENLPTDNLSFIHCQMFAPIYKKLSVGRCLKDFKGLFHLLSKYMIASLFSSLILHLKRFHMNIYQPIYDGLDQYISNVFLLKAPVNMYLKRLQNNQRLYHIVGSYILRISPYDQLYLIFLHTWKLTPRK